MNNLRARWRDADPAFKAFLLGVFFLGINAGVISSAFNNYLNDSFSLTSSQRGFLEFPRELPGFLVIFMTGLLAALPVRHWAVITGLLTAAGVAGLAFLSPGYNSMLVWMLLWSAGSHLFMTVESVMGLRFAKAGGHGRRLRQQAAAGAQLSVHAPHLQEAVDVRPGRVLLRVGMGQIFGHIEPDAAATDDGHARADRPLAGQQCP
jgi:hypothetical protein